MTDPDARDRETTASNSGEPSSEERFVTPPKRLPLWGALLLLLLLPAVVAGVWFGGRRHRIDDKPAKSPAVSAPAPAPMTAPEPRRARP